VPPAKDGGVNYQMSILGRHFRAQGHPQEIIDKLARPSTPRSTIRP